jgi:hypothetical protein
MVYVKATLVGIVTAIILAVLTTAVEAEFMLYRLRQMEGSGGIGSVSAGIESVAPALGVGFVGGFYWTVRRGRRRPASVSGER